MEEQYLSRREASAYCSSRGLPITHNGLSKFASVGGGPPFRKWGNRSVYLKSDLDKWIEEKLTPLVRSTSELPRRRADRATAG